MSKTVSICSVDDKIRSGIRLDKHLQQCIPCANALEDTSGKYWRTKLARRE